MPIPHTHHTLILISLDVSFEMSSPNDDPLFLGLDLSTQGLKAVLIDSDGILVHESSVHFDSDLPSYGTTNGAIRGPDPGEVTSPVRMWLDAYDLIMERMRAAGVDFARILGISGDGQVCVCLFLTC